MISFNSKSQTRTVLVTCSTILIAASLAVRLDAADKGSGLTDCKGKAGVQSCEYTLGADGKVAQVGTKYTWTSPADQACDAGGSMLDARRFGYKNGDGACGTATYSPPTICPQIQKSTGCGPAKAVPVNGAE